MNKIIAYLICISSFLTACGQIGPLYLPPPQPKKPPATKITSNTPSVTKSTQTS